MRKFAEIFDDMRNKYIILAILILALLPVHQLCAQRRIMVYDPELNKPMRDVLVWTDNQKPDTTNILGNVWIPEKFDTLVINKSGYVALRIPYKWVEDTIPMIRDYNHIGEVVVYANRDNDFERAVARWVKADRVEMQLRHPITGIGFNFSDLFDKQRRKDKKNAKKLEKIFRQIDSDDTNPIVHSYREALRDRMGR